MPTFYTTTQLGPKQSTTKEGFLVCQDVPIARTGELLYAPGELPIAPGPDGLVRVQVDDDCLFNPDCMASCEGKDITVSHPKGGVDVGPENHHELSVGHMQNIRRGEGALSHTLMADFVIKNARTIDAVRQRRLRQVSLGYMGRYRAIQPGLARRIAYHANHAALVPEGRAGVECAIGDEMPAETLFDRIRAAFASKNEADFESALALLPAAAPGGGPSIHIHNAPTRDESSEAKGKGDDAPWADRMKAMEDKHSALQSAHDALSEKHDKLAEKVDGKADKGGAEKKETEAKTGDSAALATAFTETAQRAEILVPGIKAPTFDAQATEAVTRDAMTAFQRTALKQASSGANADTIKAVAPVDIDAMTADAVMVAFNGAAELVRRMNNGPLRQLPGNVSGGGSSNSGSKPKTGDEINAANRKFWNN